MGAWIGSAGLVLDIVGVVLLFRYGLPQDVSRGGKSALLLEADDPVEEAKAVVYDKVAHAALVLLVTGFALQIIGNWT